jgi:hypothetical protein
LIDKYLIKSILAFFGKISSLVFASSINEFILTLRYKSKVSVELHLVNSIIVLELAFERVSTSVSYGKSFKIELEVTCSVKSL